MQGSTQKKKGQNKYAKFQTPLKKLNKNLYNYADDLLRDGTLKAPVMFTLKAIIFLRKLNWPTIRQINATRKKRHLEEFAQATPVTDRTIITHIAHLKKLGLIDKDTFYHDWGSRSDITLSGGLKKLVDSHDEETSSSNNSSPLKGRGREPLVDSRALSKPKNETFQDSIEAPAPMGAAREEIDMVKADWGLVARERLAQGLPLFGIQKQALAYLEGLEAQGRVRVDSV